MTKAPRPTHRVTVAFLGLALVGLLGIFANPLADLAARFNAEIVTGGTGVYASLRVASSMMNVAKDADIGGSVAVASVQVSPGQVLEPVTATIDRMADLLFGLVLVSSVLAATLPAVAKLGGLVLALGAMTELLTARLPLRLGRAAMTLGISLSIVVPCAYCLAFLMGDHLTTTAWRNAEAVFAEFSTKLGTDVAPTEVTALGISETGVNQAGASPTVEKGLIGGVVDTLGSFFGKTGDAVAGAAQAAAGFVSALPDQIAANAQIVVNGVGIASDLFDASIQIGTAYLVRMIVLPIIILLGAFWLLRQAQSDKHPSRLSAL